MPNARKRGFNCPWYNSIGFSEALINHFLTEAKLILQAGLTLLKTLVNPLASNLDQI